MKKALTDCIPHDCDIYMDDVLVKDLRTTYNKEEVIPGVWQYIFKHLQKLDQMLFNLKVAGLMIAPLKSQFYIPAIKIVGYVCNIEGWHPETAKVIKILDWSVCTDAHAAWFFIGVVVYYQ